MFGYRWIVVIFCCWLLASLAFAGSLFFSEVMELIPCKLCWYQRILMYPLVVLFFVGTKVSFSITFRFTFPLVVLGSLVALYHNLLQWQVISEELSPCVQGISCSAKYIEWWGFITIPLLSLLAFLLIGVLLLYGKREFKDE